MVANSIAGFPNSTPSGIDRKTLWISATAIVATSTALWADKPLKDAAAALMGPVIGWRVAQSAHTSDAQTLAVEALAKETVKLGLPAQISIVLGWKGLLEKATAVLESKMSEPMDPSLRCEAAERAVQGAVIGKASWLTGRTLFLSTYVPTMMLWIASRLPALIPFGYVWGVLATTFAYPLISRLEGWVRMRTSREPERLRTEVEQTDFYRELCATGERGNHLGVNYHLGTHERNSAMVRLWLQLMGALSHPDLEQAHELAAAAIFETAAFSPNVAVDESMARQCSILLSSRFRDAESRERIRATVVEWAIQKKVSVAEVTDRLLALLPTPAGAAA